MDEREIELTVEKKKENNNLHCDQCGALLGIEQDKHGNLHLIKCPNGHGVLLIDDPEKRKRIQKELINAGAPMIPVGDKYEDNLKNRIKGLFGL